MKLGSFGRTAGAIAVAGLVLRIAYVRALGPGAPLGSDGTWYALQAGTIADHFQYLDVGKYYGLRGAVPTAQFPPAWPGVLALAHLVGVTSLNSYRVVGGLVGATTIFMTAFIGRRLVSAPVGLIAAAFVAVSPWMIAADGSLMAESLFTALVTASVLVAISVRTSPSLGRFALLGVLLGLATLTRTDGLVVGAALVTVIAWCVPGPVLRRGAFATAAVGMMLLVLLPWTVRNQSAMDAFVPLSNNSGSLLGGANCASTYSNDIGGWDFECIKAVEQSGRSEVVRTDLERSHGLAYARDHLPRLAVTIGARMVRGWGLWSPVALADTETGESRNRTLQLAGWPVEMCILGLAVAGAFVAVRMRVRAAPIFAVIGAATIVLAISWGNQRFRGVAEPELAILAAVAANAIWTRRRRHVSALLAVASSDPKRSSRSE